MSADVHNGAREERRAQLERRRAAVAHQLRRLTIELADLDRQLDESSSRSVDRRVNTGWRPRVSRHIDSAHFICPKAAAVRSGTHGGRRRV